MDSECRHKYFDGACLNCGKETPEYLSKEGLTNLREIFRKRMEQEDFCIGQEQVEKLFRELLNEPEPVREPITPASPEEQARMRETLNIEINRLIGGIGDIFEQDDAFFKAIKKR